MNAKEVLEIKTQILRAGALMRQANFTERGVDNETITFMITAAFNDVIKKEENSAAVRGPKRKRKEESKHKQLAQVIEFKRKEITDGI